MNECISQQNQRTQKRTNEQQQKTINLINEQMNITK